MKVLFDSHTHINSEVFDEDREDLIRAIEASDVAYAVDIGVDIPTSEMAVSHAAKYGWCYAAVGIHPHEAKLADEQSFAALRELTRKPKVLAVGEIGLDYYYNYSDPAVQQDWFRRQIRLALDLDLPMVIHDRDANDDVMRILKEEGVFAKSRTGRFPVHPDGGPDARLLMHCYSGSRELAEQYVKLGATISFSGTLTYKNARRAVETADALDVRRILVETDAPYLTPEPFRGRRNMPPYVEHTVRRLGVIKGISYDEIAAITCENARRFFGLK